MAMNRNANAIYGNFLVLMLPLMVALMLMTWLVCDLGRAALLSAKNQTAADAILLSLLRIRIEALETVSVRWHEFGDLFHEVDPAGTVRITGDHWQEISSKAAALKQSLSGYKGRLTAVIKVAAQANNLSVETVQVLSEDRSQLAITPEPAFLRDENQARMVDGVWYQREWDSPQRLASSAHQEKVMVSNTLPLLGGKIAGFPQSVWNISATSSGRVKWDVPLEDSFIQVHGNGGYPRSWNEALENNFLNPFRYAVYRSEVEE